MTTTKKPYTFRLSLQAQQYLQEIVQLTGMTQAAAVEYALALMRANLKGSKMERSTVTNRYDKELDYDAAVNLMDNGLREKLHQELAPCSDQEFFDAYVKLHAQTFGEDWVLDDPNPVW